MHGTTVKKKCNSCHLHVRNMSFNSDVVCIYLRTNSNICPL